MDKASYLVYWTKEYILIIGENLNTESHNHHAVQLSFRLSNNMSVICNNHIHDVDIVMINKDVEHKFESDGLSAMLLVNPECLFAEDLLLRLANDDCINFTYVNETIRNMIIQIYMEKSSIELANKFYSEIRALYSLNGVQLKKVIDERIESALEYMKSNFELSPKEVSKMIFLSESRFQHLFKSEIGISYSKYILWLRIQKTVKSMLDGLSITDSAIDAGFSDGSHFSRTVKSTFGLSMKAVFKDSRYIQVIIEE